MGTASLIYLSISGHAWAQNTDPGGVLGGGVDRLPLPDNETPPVEFGAQLPPVDHLLGRPGSEGGTPIISVMDIVIEGVTIPEMAKTIESLELEIEAELRAKNGAATEVDLIWIRDRITNAYIARGYLNSGAIIPSQSFANGVLQLNVVEGRLEKTIIRLNAKDSHDADSPSGWHPLKMRESYVTSRLWPNANEPLNQVELQRRFQGLAADPTIRKIEAALAPGSIPGEAELYVDVVEEKPYWLALNAASERSPSIGGERASINAGVRNLMGFGDVLSISAGLTEGLTDASVNYVAPLGNTRFAINLHGQYSDAEVVERPLTNLNVLSESASYGAGLVVSLLEGVALNCVDDVDVQAQCAPHRTRASLYELDLSFDISKKTSQSELLGTPFSFSPGAVDGETDNTVASIVLNGLHQSPRQVLAGRVRYTQGIETLPNMEATSPPEDFSAVLGQAQFARRLFSELDHQIIARLDYQYAPDTLFTSERYAFGGIDSVRGYRKNEVLSDNAVVGSVEYRMGLSPFSNALDDWSVGLFVDAGQGWNATLDDPINDTLMSVGVQLNMSLFDRIQGSVYYGHQLEEIPDPADEKLQDSGFGFRLSFRGF